MKTELTVSEDIRNLIERAAVRDAHPVSEQVAGRLIDEFGTADAVNEANRDELQQVNGIDPATAEAIAPRRSALLDEQISKASEGVLIPQYLDMDGLSPAREEMDDYPPMPPEQREGGLDGGMKEADS
jgi:hypothetical protein